MVFNAITIKEPVKTTLQIFSVKGGGDPSFPLRVLGMIIR